MRLRKTVGLIQARSKIRSSSCEDHPQNSASSFDFSALHRRSRAQKKAASIPSISQLDTRSRLILRFGPCHNAALIEWWNRFELWVVCSFCFLGFFRNTASSTKLQIVVMFFCNSLPIFRKLLLSTTVCFSNLCFLLSLLFDPVPLQADLASRDYLRQLKQDGKLPEPEELSEGGTCHDSSS